MSRSEDIVLDEVDPKGLFEHATVKSQRGGDERGKCELRPQPGHQSGPVGAEQVNGQFSLHRQSTADIHAGRERRTHARAPCLSVNLALQIKASSEVDAPPRRPVGLRACLHIGTRVSERVGWRCGAQAKNLT
jgi:hypothetical protein